MHSLYLLSFMLTANHTTSQECYLDSIDYVFNGNPVFKGWARSWCKRSVVKNAIRLVFSERVDREGGDIWFASSASIAVDSVTGLTNLERFVFVMSVLLRYSDRECSVLLDCRMQEIVNARLLALRRLGDFASVQQSVMRNALGVRVEPHCHARKS